MDGQEVFEMLPDKLSVNRSGVAMVVCLVVHPAFEYTNAHEIQGSFASTTIDSVLSFKL
jgi:hypothetical protein